MSSTIPCVPPGGFGGSADHTAALASVGQLDIIAAELGGLAEELCGIAHHARRLDAATQWHATAATAFHALAESWAIDLLHVARLAMQAHADACAARDRTAASWECR